MVYVVKEVILTDYGYMENILGMFTTYYRAETFMNEAYKMMDEHDKFSYFSHFVIESWKLNHCKWTERTIYYQEYFEDSD